MHPPPRCAALLASHLSALLFDTIWNAGAFSNLHTRVKSIRVVFFAEVVA